jgi:small subunit ribosomal protein S18
MIKFNLKVRLKAKKKRITPKTDYFLSNGIEYIDYKDAILRKFLNRQGRIVNRSYTQLTSKTQRRVSIAIRRARQMALLPYMIIDQNE